MKHLATHRYCRLIAERHGPAAGRGEREKERDGGRETKVIGPRPVKHLKHDNRGGRGEEAEWPPCIHRSWVSGYVIVFASFAMISGQKSAVCGRIRRRKRRLVLAGYWRGGLGEGADTAACQPNLASSLIFHEGAIFIPLAHSIFFCIYPASYVNFLGTQN